MISVFYTFYGQRHMIPIIQAQGIHATIIDDGYPEPLGKVAGCDVYRINEDIAWNIPGAKNLGFHVLDGWILHLPIDHVIDQRTYDALDSMPKNKNEIFFPWGKFPDGTPEHTTPHDMVLIHKSMFDKIGGYDEDFCGHYGYEDGLFYMMCSNNGHVRELKNVFIQLYPQGACANKNRDFARNGKIFMAKDKIKMTTPKLRFTWQKVE